MIRKVAYHLCGVRGQLTSVKVRPTNATPLVVQPQEHSRETGEADPLKCDLSVGDVSTENHATRRLDE